MKPRVLIALAALFLTLGLVQTAEAQGGNRIRYWIENTPDGCANIYIYVYTPYDWPWLALNSGNGDEAPLSTWDVQPKYVCPYKNKGVRHVNYTMRATFDDGTVETHNFYYDINGSYPSGGAPPPPPPPPNPNPNPNPYPSPYYNFFANPQYTAPGQCTSLRWDIDGVSQIYFNNQGVTGHESRTVCPYTTSTYTLRVIRYDRSEFYPTVTVYVTGAPTCGTPYTPPCGGGGPGGGPGGGGPGGPYVIEKLMNLNSYCAYRYGASAAANFTNFGDAYSWGCYNGSYRIGAIDMTDVCRTQHPEAPIAKLKDRNNAYSWFCSN